MPEKIRKIIFIIAMTLLAAMGLTLFACSPTPAAADQTLVLITLTPEYVNNIFVGEIQQFTAEGTYADTSKSDITSQITCWGTSDASVATISKSGLVTAVGAGTCYVSAGFSGLKNDFQVMLTVVTQPVLSKANNS
jgi:hypothetical protein